MCVPCTEEKTISSGDKKRILGPSRLVGALVMFSAPLLLRLAGVVRERERERERERKRERVREREIRERDKN